MVRGAHEPYNEDHQLASLASHMGDLLEAYDEARAGIPR